jgi:hypothetical protein
MNIEINEHPEITTVNIKTVEVGQEYSVDYEAADDKTPEENLTWSIQTNASWLSFNTKTGALLAIPEEGDVGNYWINITVFDDDGAFTSTNFTLSVIKLITNNRPKLSDNDLTPDSGNTNTEFTFTVVYTDKDNDPGEVWVWIDGEKHKMIPESGDSDFINGVVYSYNTKLEKGIHKYYFTASDGSESAVAGDTFIPIDANNPKNTPNIEHIKTQENDEHIDWSFFIILFLIIIVIIIILEIKMKRNKKTKQKQSVDKDSKTDLPEAFPEQLENTEVQSEQVPVPITQPQIDYGQESDSIADYHFDKMDEE